MSLVPSNSSDIDSYIGVEGLEDVDPTDISMPILKINHRKGIYVNTLTGEEFASFTAIILGMVKQRVLWPPDLPDEGSKERPLCRSYDFKEGHPQEEKFPWEKSGFSQSPTLPCLSCPLQEWGSHPSKSAPWCSAQHVYSMLQVREDGSTTPLLLYVQRSGLKTSKDWISAFATEKRPFFTVYTAVSLEERMRGSNPYSVPKFVRGTETDINDHPNFAQMGKQIRVFLQTPFRADEDTDNEADTQLLAETGIEEQQAPVQATNTASPLAGPTVAPPPASMASKEDDLPF